MAAMSTLAPVGLDKYPAKQHARRVARNLNMPQGLILLQGAKNKTYAGSSEPMPFRQSRAFYYLTGCNEAGAWTTYDVAADKLTLWLPLPKPAKAAWNAEKVGPAVLKKEAMSKSDVDDVKFVRALEKGKAKKTNLRKVLKEHAEKDGSKFAYFKMPNGLVGKPVRMAMKERRKIGLRNALCKSRARKDDYEVAQIRSAAAVSAEAHTDVIKALPGLNSEHEAEAVFLSSCIAQRAKSQAYAPTFAAGQNATRLRYCSNAADFEKAQTLVVDAGSKWNEYAAALTRTVPLNPSNPGTWPSAEAEMLYNAVMKIQEQSIKQLAPGQKFIHAHWNAVHMAIDALLDMGVLKGDHMEIFHAGTALAFMPHGLGHFVGLEANDVAPPALFKGPAGKKGVKGKGKGKGKKGPGAKKIPGAKQGAGLKKGPGAKRMNMKGLEAQDPLETPLLPIRKGPGMKKGSWGKKGPNAAKAVVAENLAALEPRPIDEKADFEVIEKPVAEKPAGKQGRGMKKGPKGPGMKKGAKAHEQAKGKGKGKGKKAGPMRPRDKRFARTRMVYRAYVSKNEGVNPAFKALNDDKIAPAYFSLRPRFCRAPCTPTAPLLKQGNVLTVAPGLYFNKRVLARLMKREKQARFVNKEVLDRFIAVGGVCVKDTVLVTETGVEVLTSEAPKGVRMMALMKEAASA